MLLAPLIIVVAGIARVTSRIVRGVGQEKRAGNHRRRTPPRKIRARFRGDKHTSLAFSVGKPSGVGFFSAQKTTVVTAAVTLRRRYRCRVVA
jgi:hypothetical protein